MRNRVIVGLMATVLAVASYFVYLDGQAAGTVVTSQTSALPGDTWTGRTSWGVTEIDRRSQFVGTIRLDLEHDLLARLDAESPRLVLEASDGSRAMVLVWQVARGQAVLQQFNGLQPAHYTALEVMWPDGMIDMVPIDVRFGKPAHG